MKTDFDLLQTVEQGGCSAKLPAQLLETIVKNIPVLKREELLVGTDTHDDAAVWKVNADTAIISTTDFFPPLCSDPYEFGQIAAANALSDVFAMGGTAIMALNLVMFPSSRIDISVLEEILRGGADKVAEAGAVLAGGAAKSDSDRRFAEYTSNHKKRERSSYYPLVTSYRYAYRRSAQGKDGRYHSVRTKDTAVSGGKKFTGQGCLLQQCC